MQPHNPCKRLALYDFLLGILTTIGIPLFAYRILVAAYVIHTPTPLLNAGTSLATGILLPGAVGLAWRRSVLRNRAERAEMLTLISELERRVSDTENAVWWGTNEPEAERTVEVEDNVRPLRHRKSS